MPTTVQDMFQRLTAIEAILFAGGSPLSPGVTLLQGPQAEPPTILSGATDAITPNQGLFVVTKAGVDAMTITAPLAGAVANGGDDGKLVTVMSTTANAHTITGPTNCINGSKHIATFAAAVANLILLQAYNGVWYMVSQIGITLT